MLNVMKNRRSTIRMLLLGLVAIVLGEQMLVKYLDYRAKWDDAAFQAYLESVPTQRNPSGAAFGCKYQKIAFIYRYRICLRDAGLKDAATGERQWLLHVVGVTGYLSLVREEGGDRETWDTTSIWVVDDKLQFVEDIRT